MNIIQLFGRLGADPEVRFTQSGQKVTTFSVATNSRRGGKDETVWWRVTVWGDRFDNMISYLKKGSAIIVIGELRPPEMFTDRNGQQRVGLEVTANNLYFPPYRTERTEDTQTTGTPGASGPAESYGQPPGPAGPPGPATPPTAAPDPFATTETPIPTSIPAGTTETTPPPQDNVTKDDIPF